MSRVQRPAKFTMPQQRGVVARDRLFAQLDAQRDKAAIWISGVPGAGKTTLAASYVQARNLTCVWIGIDDADSDCAELFRAFTRAVGAEAAKRKALPVFAPEHLPSLQHFARRFFRALFERLPPSCCIVLDNVHSLEGPSATGMLRTAIEETPADVQWLLLSRTLPPPEFMALEAQGRLHCVDNDLLRFSIEELPAMLPAHSQQEQAVIHAMTQGWSAGIVLAARSGAGHNDNERGDRREAIFVFFAHEILRAMPPSEQRFLQLVSLLPEMSVAQAQALTAEPRAAAILEGLYRRGLFTSYRPGSPGVYQFHSLMQAFLKQEASAAIPAHDLAAAQRQAAQILQEAGDVASAYALLAQSGEWERAGRLVMDSADQMLQQGRFATLRGWIEAMPAPMVDSQGWLLFWLGKARMSEDELAACAWFDKAHLVFKEQGEVRGQVRSAASAMAAILMGESDFQAVSAWAPRLGELLGSLEGRWEPEDRLDLAIALVTAQLLGSPVVSSEKTLSVLEQSLVHLESKPAEISEATVVAAGVALLMYCIRERNLALFERTRRLIEPVLNHKSISPLIQGRWWVQVGDCNAVFYLQPDSTQTLAAASAAYQKAREIADRDQLLPLKSSILMAETTFAQVRRDETAFAALVSELGQVVEASRPIIASVYSLMLCRMHLVQGRYEAALRAALEAEEVANKAAAKGSSIFSFTILHCCSLAMLGRELEAIALVQQTPDQFGRRALLVKTLLHTMYTMQRLRQGEEHLASLSEALRLAAEAGWTLMLEALPPVASRLFAQALEQGIEPEFVRACIDRQKLRAPPEAGEQWPWAIRLRLLGPFELRVGEKLADFGPKMPRQSIRLLQAIAVGGIEGVDARQVQDWLWAKSEASNKPLSMALMRLRNICGDADAIELREGRLTLDRRRVWTDLQQFEGVSEQLLHADLAASSAEQLDTRAQQLFQLCRGPLLPDEPAQAWLAGPRERYRARLERVVTRLGQHLEQAEFWSAALNLYARAIEHDNLAERMYQGLIRCHLALEQPAEALRAYRRCRELLSIVLSVAPSAQTEALIEHCRVR